MFSFLLSEYLGFPGGANNKEPLPMQETEETWIWSLSWGDRLEEDMATHSSILAWRIPWGEEPGGLQFMELQRVGHNWSDLAHPEVCTSVWNCWILL